MSFGSGVIPEYRHFDNYNRQASQGRNGYILFYGTNNATYTGDIAASVTADIILYNVTAGQLLALGALLLTPPSGVTINSVSLDGVQVAGPQVAGTILFTQLFGERIPAYSQVKINATNTNAAGATVTFGITGYLYPQFTQPGYYPTL